MTPIPKPRANTESAKLNLVILNLNSYHSKAVKPPWKIFYWGEMEVKSSVRRNHSKQLWLRCNPVHAFMMSLMAAGPLQCCYYQQVPQLSPTETRPMFKCESSASLWKGRTGSSSAEPSVPLLSSLICPLVTFLPIPGLHPSHKPGSSSLQPSSAGNTMNVPIGILRPEIIRKYRKNTARLQFAARSVRRTEQALPWLHNHWYLLIFLSSIPRIQMWFWQKGNTTSVYTAAFLHNPQLVLLNLILNNIWQIINPLNRSSHEERQIHVC